MTSRIPARPLIGWMAVIAGVMAGMLCEGSASAGSTPATDFELTLSSPRTSSGTGVGLYILYRRPGDPNAKPSALRRVVIAAPPGSRYDGAAIPACRASDEQLMAEGAAACPASSYLGGGTVTALTGLGAPIDPVRLDATFFNRRTGVIQVLTQPGTGGATVVLHGTFTAANTITFASIPSVPGGPPDFATAVREVRVRLIDAGSPSRPFLITPPLCPQGHRWVSQLTYSTADGHTYTAQSATPCSTRPGSSQAESTAHAMRLSVSPSTAAVAANVRYRFRLRARDGRCVRQAAILLAGHRVLTDRRGRAALELRLWREGPHVVRAQKAGCGTASTVVSVIDRGASTTPSRSGPSSFSGSCELTGMVFFRPALSVAPQTGRVQATAQGSCSGTFTASSGQMEAGSGIPVLVVAESKGTESCESGVGTGAGYIAFGSDRLRFSYSELRAGPALVLRADGSDGGSAVAEGNVSPSASPTAILQDCGSTGLTEAPIDIRLATDGPMSG